MLWRSGELDLLLLLGGELLADEVDLVHALLGEPQELVELDDEVEVGGGAAGAGGEAAGEDGGRGLARGREEAGRSRRARKGPRVNTEPVTTPVLLGWEASHVQGEAAGEGGGLGTPALAAPHRGPGDGTGSGRQ